MEPSRFGLPPALRYPAYRAYWLGLLASVSGFQMFRVGQGWLIYEAVAKGQAMKQADKRQAYTLWGATPFLRFSQQHQPDLEILVSADPLLQRVMAISLVNADKVQGINKAGAEMLRDYLLSTPVQARISAYRQRGYEAQLWWPAARHN